jgi:hypothetical protein
MPGQSSGWSSDLEVIMKRLLRAVLHALLRVLLALKGFHQCGINISRCSIRVRSTYMGLIGLKLPRMVLAWGSWLLFAYTCCYYCVPVFRLMMDKKLFMMSSSRPPVATANQSVTKSRDVSPRPGVRYSEKPAAFSSFP